jgi:hypothetical protein
MTPPPQHRSRLSDEGGAVTWVTAVLLVAVAVAAYLAWVWVPIYFVNYEVKQVVRDYANQAVKNPADAHLVEAMVHKFRTLDTEPVVGEDGRIRKVPVVDVKPQDVVWERTLSTVDPPTLRVAFEYTRRVTYPWIERVDEKTFQIDLNFDLSRPDWGPAR